MDLPMGYPKQHTGGSQGKKLVCKLDKSIYGLKQASMQWFSKLFQVILRHEFQQSRSDYSLFTKGTGDFIITLLVYVNGIIITRSNKRVNDSLKAFLYSQFKLKDLGKLKYFLGLEIARSQRGIYLSQRHCIL